MERADKLKTITLKLPTALLDDLSKRANEIGFTRTELIRYSINNYLQLEDAKKTIQYMQSKEFKELLEKSK